MEYKIHPYCDICTSDFQAVVDHLKVENDQLRAENERLRAALLEIANIFSKGGLRTVTMADRCVMIAEQALNEVTK